MVAGRAAVRLRPGAGLTCDPLMVILALLIGLVAGAAGVYAVGLRRALVDRDQGTFDRGASRQRERIHRAGDGPTGCLRGAAAEVARQGRAERGPPGAAAPARLRRDPQGARDRPPE